MTGDTEPDDNPGSHRRDAASPCLKDINAAVRAVDVAIKQPHTVPALTTLERGRASGT